MSDRPFGFNSLAVPTYLAKGNATDDPGLAAWKQEHPNWMVAGTWTPAPRPASIMPPTSDQGRAIAQPVPDAGFSSLDPATISVADFRRIADKPHEPTNAPARSDQAHPDDPLPGMIPDIHASGGQVFRRPMAAGSETERNSTHSELSSGLRHPEADPY